jgi:hypothetical protein
MIDWEQKTITGKSGKVYKIDPENVTIGRLREYEILSLMLAFSSDFKTFYTTLTEIIAQVEKLTAIGQIFSVLSKLKNLVAGIGNYTENSEPKIIRFCALFCTYEGEELDKFTDEQVKIKYEDWSHIPAKDFFLLVSECIPSFRDAYKMVKKEMDQ